MGRLLAGLTLGTGTGAVAGNMSAEPGQEKKNMKAGAIVGAAAGLGLAAALGIKGGIKGGSKKIKSMIKKSEIVKIAISQQAARKAMLSRLRKLDELKGKDLDITYFREADRTGQQANNLGALLGRDFSSRSQELATNYAKGQEKMYLKRYHAGEGPVDYWIKNQHMSRGRSIAKSSRDLKRIPLPSIQ